MLIPVAYLPGLSLRFCLRRRGDGWFYDQASRDFAATPKIPWGSVLPRGDQISDPNGSAVYEFSLAIYEIALGRRARQSGDYDLFIRTARMDGTGVDEVLRFSYGVTTTGELGPTTGDMPNVTLPEDVESRPGLSSRRNVRRVE